MEERAGPEPGGERRSRQGGAAVSEEQPDWRERQSAWWERCALEWRHHGVDEAWWYGTEVAQMKKSGRTERLYEEIADLEERRPRSRSAAET